MKACSNCQLRGYSRELCAVHVRHCQQGEEARPTPPSVRVAVRMAVGVAVGVSLSLLIVTAASFVSGMSVFRTLLPILVIAASVAGGVCGVVQGMQAIRPIRDEVRGEKIAEQTCASRTYSGIPIGILLVGRDDQRAAPNRTRG